MEQAVAAAAASADVVTLFMDEASFYRQPSQGYLWAAMGRAQPKMRYSTRSNTLVRVAGFLNAVTGVVHAWDYGKVTAPRLRDCFLRVAQAYPHATRIVIVLDNWPVHFHPIVLQALARDPRLELAPLPTYAPWLNPIEKVWRWVRQHVSHAHPWSDDFLLFKAHLRQELDRLAHPSTELLRYVGLFL